VFEKGDISQVLNCRAFFVRWCSLFAAIVFLLAQTLSVAHAHDHETGEPLNQSCEICIVAVNDDVEADISAEHDLDDPNLDKDGTSNFCIQIDRLGLEKPKGAPSIDFGELSLDPPPDPVYRRGSARAPPV